MGRAHNQLLAAIAVAVQRGNALTVLCGYTRTKAANMHVELGSWPNADGSEERGSEWE